jgi:hypothetical protein
MENVMSDSKLTNLTGLWLQTPKSGGNKFFSGKVNQESLGELSLLLANNPGKDLRVLIFKNTKQRDEKDPGYNLVCQIDEPREKKQQIQVDEDAPF